MDQTELYKGYRIRTYQREPGRWFADIQKQDGSDFLILLEPDGVPQRFVAITRATSTAEAAIKLAKHAIDRGGGAAGATEMRSHGDDEIGRPLDADHIEFYKVEKWTKDGTTIDGVLYAGDNIDEAREIYERAIKHRPRIKLTIRRRNHIVEEWPP
jgi:hypothetical protein